MADLEAIRGDTNPFNVTVVRANAPVNIDNAKLWFTAKSDPKADDTDAAIALNSEDDPTQVVILIPAEGRAQVILLPDDTKDLENNAYYYDVQMKESTDVVTTVARGILYVDQDVTQSD